MNNIKFIDPDRLKKQRVALVHLLLGRGWHDALRAMRIAEKFHCGTRKDGITPEFAHQIGIALYILTLQFPEGTNIEHYVITIMLHDVVEDYNYPLKKIKKKFGKAPSKAVEAISKEIGGSKKDFVSYMTGLALDIMGAICKGGDRINNFQTMVGVFTIDKQKSYIEEGIEILKMLKEARYNFPEYSNALLNIEFVLRAQIELISYSHTIDFPPFVKTA
jgi:(p)ppGpp synthase/HD superfamily hydrolase